MRGRRSVVPCLVAAALLAGACARGDDASDSTTAPSATSAAPTTPTTVAAAATQAPATQAAAATSAPAGATTAAETTAPATTAGAGAGDTGSRALTPDEIADQCASEPLEATEIGVTASEITVEVGADTGSPLAPGLFQGNIDALNAFATYVNSIGGVGCRQLVVRTWDTKLDPNESKNGQIDACANALALVGSNSLFNPDVTTLTDCQDQAGNPTGLPNMTALANDTTELCAPTTYLNQALLDTCPIVPGVRTMRAMVGPTAWLAAQHPEGLRGLFLVPGDLPTTRQSAIPQIEGQTRAGVTFDGTPPVSGRDEQAAFTPRIQVLKANNGNYVYDGSNDAAMIKMQKETAAQGLDTSEVVWTCSLACYTRAFQETGGPTAEGTYVWMQFLPFEEADVNPALQAYIDSVGADKVDSFGAQAWQAAMAFNEAVNQIVAEDGPNAITRARLLEQFASMHEFSADGWAAPKDLRGASTCYVMLQLQQGAFVRVWPEERGTFDCSEDNMITVEVDPAAAAEQLG